MKYKPVQDFEGMPHHPNGCKCGMCNRIKGIMWRQQFGEVQEPMVNQWGTWHDHNCQCEGCMIIVRRMEAEDDE